MERSTGSTWSTVGLWRWASWTSFPTASLPSTFSTTQVSQQRGYKVLKFLFLTKVLLKQKSVLPGRSNRICVLCFTRNSYKVLKMGYGTVPGIMTFAIIFIRS